jgi:hypothetical protein
MSFADLAARLQPAVVNISTEQRVPVAQTRNPMEEMLASSQPGSPGPSDARHRAARRPGFGFIISPDGYVVTNTISCRARAAPAQWTSHRHLTDRKEYKARIVGRDPATDLALLKIDGRKPARSCASVSRANTPSATGSWQSAIRWAWAARSLPASLGDRPQHRRDALRPLHPDDAAITAATPAVRCSTSTHTSSASIRPCIRKRWNIGIASRSRGSGGAVIAQLRTATRVARAIWVSAFSRSSRAGRIFGLPRTGAS